MNYSPCLPTISATCSEVGTGTHSVMFWDCFCFCCSSWLALRLPRPQLSPGSVSKLPVLPELESLETGVKPRRLMRSAAAFQADLLLSRSSREPAELTPPWLWILSMQLVL